MFLHPTDKTKQKLFFVDVKLGLSYLKKHRSRLFEKRVLRKILGPKRDT
jgi:hypothetical protein